MSSNANQLKDENLRQRHPENGKQLHHTNGNKDPNVLSPTEGFHAKTSVTDLQAKLTNARKSSIPEKHWLIIFFVLFSIIITSIKIANNHLPATRSVENSFPGRFSEESARDFLRKIVGFGPRPAGSKANDDNTMNYIMKSVAEIRKVEHPTIKVESEMQYCSGSYVLDFLGGFANSYSNISNAIVRLSSINQISDNALLLNCHTDSAIGAVGASDDAVACSVMLEILRVILSDHDTPLLSSIIFLFNGAEENVLQGSHGFITQHHWAKDVKAFINLEAAGAGGKEVLFQTGPNSPWLALTWARHAPHPFGSVFAQELFQSGVIPSDTDFRIFRDYGKIPGIDLAYMRNGYVYHTIFDDEHMILPGCIQRAGDNILAVVRNLAQSRDSMLHAPGEYRHGSVAFFDVLGVVMVTLPMRLLSLLNFMCLFAACVYVGRKVVRSSHDSSVSAGKVQKATISTAYGKRLMKAVGTTVLAMVCTLLLPAVIGFLLTATGKTLTFFSNANLCLFIYLPPAVLALFAVHRFARNTLFKEETASQVESIFFDASLILWTLLLFQLNRYGIQSSVFLLTSIAPALFLRCFAAASLFAPDSAGNDVTSSGRLPTPTIVLLSSRHEQQLREKLTKYRPHVKLMLTLSTQLLATLMSLTHGTMLLDFFVPLCGRLGTEIPSDVIIALLVASVVLICSLLLVSLLHLPESLRGIMTTLSVMSLFSFLVVQAGLLFPYSVEGSSPAPMRMYNQHIERQFFGFDGKIVRYDSGISVNCIDYHCYDDPSVGSKELFDTPFTPCDTGVFCHWPWLLPFSNVVTKPRYMPAPPPATPTIKWHPLVVAVVDQKLNILRENASYRVYTHRIFFKIDGPTHTSLQVGPLKHDQFHASLTNWSIQGDPRVAAHKATTLKSRQEGCTFDNWYFIYHGSGRSSPSWRPWIELTVVEDINLPEPTLDSRRRYLRHPVVEVGVSAQYMPTEGRRCQTHELRQLNETLQDWVSQVCWASTYRNYLL